jgi:hypothetical protein
MVRLSDPIAYLASSLKLLFKQSCWLKFPGKIKQQHQHQLSYQHVSWIALLYGKPFIHSRHLLAVFWWPLIFYAKHEDACVNVSKIFETFSSFDWFTQPTSLFCHAFCFTWVIADQKPGFVHSMYIQSSINTLRITLHLHVAPSHLVILRDLAQDYLWLSQRHALLFQRLRQAILPSWPVREERGHSCITVASTGHSNIWTKRSQQSRQ